MKRTKEVNLSISQKIEEALGITFENYEFKLDGWGDVDNYCFTEDRTLLLLECEEGQKHPTTNVLKVWPYLEENYDQRIVLFHYFFPKNKAPKNRLRLCQFLGEKLEVMFDGRFQYVGLGSGTEGIRLCIEDARRRDLCGVFNKQIF